MTPTQVLRTTGIAATLAALVASTGDLFLLWVTNAESGALGPAHEVAERWLLLGRYLGTLAIPLDAAG